ncbi:MAG: MFS transporter [Acidobacteria bacterium]|nr:MFS transporter [Acidobacteriota bacterium]
MEVSAPVSLPAYWRLLKSNRNFRLLWTAQAISEVGDWLYMVALYSLLLELTGSARVVAFAFMLQVLPQFFVAPAAGVINDRVSRKQVMIVADYARALIVFLMIFGQTRELIWFLYVLLFAETVFWAMFEPARTAVIPNVTRSDEEKLVANGLSSTTWSFTLAVGSAVGGVLAAYFGRETVFIINSLSFIASALLVRRMRFHEPHTEPVVPLSARDLADFSPIVEGVQYVRRDPRMLRTMFVKAGLGLMGTNWVLLPIFGERIFPVHVGGLDPKSAGMLGMSLLMGCRGIGALIGPMVAGLWTGSRASRFRVAILFGFLVGALGYVALSAAGSVWTASAAVVLAHSGGAIAWVYSTTLLQIQTEDRFRGRVFSAEFAFSMLVLSIITYTAGVLADAGIPVRTLAAWTGLIVLLPAVWWGRSLRLWRGESKVYNA